MECVNCNLCGLDDTRILFNKRDKFHLTEKEFSVVECQRCGLLYVNPRPSQEEMGKFYPETYSWRETLEANSFLTKWVRRLEKRYRYHLLKDEVLKVVRFSGRNCGKVLDIGCGTGDRLDVFRSLGFEAFGVETSDSADYAKEQLKLNVIKGDLFYTHNPIRVCKEVHRILKKNGLLVIQVPNKESLQCRLFRKRWAAFDVFYELVASTNISEFPFSKSQSTKILAKGT
jgi:SAM-dependent methyltransferase